MKKKQRQSTQRLDQVVVTSGSLPAPNVTGKTLTAQMSVGRVWGFDLPTLFTSYTVSSGTLASSVPIDQTNLNLFSTRFGNTFIEYRILGFRGRLRISGTSINPAGVVKCWLDEKSSATPTAAQSQDRPCVDLLISGSNTGGLDTTVEIKWVAKDLLDLDWTAVGTTATPVWLKLFANTTYTGTGMTTGATVILDGVMRVQFRGLM